MAMLEYNKYIPHLPVSLRSDFKILLITLQALNDLAPDYVSSVSSKV